MSRVPLEIHPGAVVHPDAKLGPGVTVGPYAVIGEHVVIGAGTTIGPHAVIEGWTEIGQECRIAQFACIGGPPQHLEYRGEETRVVIGNRNVIREFVTIHRGTVRGGARTVIGDDNYLMAYAHVAHDCEVGNHVIMANCASLAGHILIEDYAVLGGLAGIHQFARIGAHALVGACSGVSQDVPPYVHATGNRATPHGLNTVGLKRHGFSEETLRTLEQAYKLLYRSGLTLQEALDQIQQQLRGPEVEHFVAFIKASERGVVR
ncbi:MAG: acyl-ACP--UDP-N-acetylglucosamine O-acyltransferase [Deltaproteobacteria bacterium]|nr:acyl-ACP--UDP-N-acetylglucosamine O-acyltransferase [Deltaproteobacteria bacterium]